MKGLMIVAIIALSFMGAMAACDTGFIPISISFTGKFLNDPNGEYEVYYRLGVQNGDAVEIFSNAYVDYCKTFSGGKCKNMMSITRNTISTQESTTYCLRTISHLTSSPQVYGIDIVSYDYNTFGWCMHVKYAGSDPGYPLEYLSFCSRDSSLPVFFFPLVDSVPASMSVRRIPNQITDKDRNNVVVYTDRYADVTIRPDVLLAFINDPTTGSSIFDITYNPVDFPLTLNLEDMTLEGTVHIDSDDYVPFTIYNGAGENSKSITIDFKGIECPAANDYPVVFSRQYSSYNADRTECFALYSGETLYKTSCPGGEWFVDLSGITTPGYIHEFYDCIPKGKYSLRLMSMGSDGELVATTWDNDSFLSVIAFSHRHESIHNFEGFTIGDFSYTTTLNSNNELELTNVVNISIGPIECGDNERTVVIQKFSTTNAGSEGIEVYAGYLPEDGGQLVDQYYASANFYNTLFDPYYRVFTCLTSQNYYLRLKSKTYEDNYKQRVTAPGWSTSLSHESITYTNLENVVVTAPHPSFARIDVLKSQTYYGGAIEADDIEFTLEGENIAVFSDRNHNPISKSRSAVGGHDGNDNCTGDILECHYDIAIFINGPAEYHITYNNGQPIEGNTITTFVDSPIDLEVKCVDETDDNTDCMYIESYIFTCAFGSLSSNTTYSTGACEQYGFVLTDSGLNAGASGVITTPNGEAGKITVTIEPVIRSAYSGRVGTKRTVTYIVNGAVAECSIFFKQQDEEFTYRGLSIPPEDVHCAINNMTLALNTHYKVTQEANRMLLKFTISSADIIACELQGRYIKIYSQPSCAFNAQHPLDLPLYQSVDYDAINYSEKCVGSRANEYVCVYDPLTMRAEILNHETVCHQYNDDTPVPAGHGYITGHFFITNVNNNYPDVNASYMPSWMKRLIEDAFENESPVPMRNAYVTNITYDQSSAPNVALTVLFDTAYEYANDLYDAFMTPRFNFLNNVNAKLNEEIPTYFNEHDISLEYLEIELTPTKCATLEDNEGYEFVYYENGVASTVSVESATWNETTIWYYAYNAVPAPYNNENSESFDAEGNKFWGAFTRYCKPKYYDAFFLGTNVNSAVQTNVPDITSLFFTVRITNLDPRSVTTEVRYTVARALTRYVLNRDSTDDSIVEIFDFNVHMIEGANPVEFADDMNPSMMLYQDTVFYVQIRVRSNDNEQFERARSNILNVITDPTLCTIEDDVNNKIIDFFAGYYPEEWKANHKDVYICFYPDWNPNTPSEAKSLRY